jgi:hypothetical protein
MYKTTSFFFILAFMFSSYGVAKGKMDINFGYFTLDAKAKDKKGQVDSFGSYQLNYRYAFANYLEVSVGYSLIASKTISGDFGFGPDIGIVYFPLSSANPIDAYSENVNFRSFELYKPYGTVSFHQRQYQSIQSSYAGFSVGLGLEIYWKSNMSFNFLARYLPLGGPDSATSNELDLMTGLIFSF